MLRSLRGEACVLCGLKPCQAFLPASTETANPKQMPGNRHASRTDAALRLRAAGADFIVICTNTMHIVADDVRERAGVDLLHIADATGEEIKVRGLTRVGLLGTKFTMQNDFYKKRLEHFGIEAIVPGDEDQEEIHRIIFDELCVGLIKQSSRERLKKVITSLSAQGAQGVVLGCTEIPLIISQEDSPIPVFDTTRIHALAAVKWALEDI